MVASIASILYGNDYHVIIIIKGFGRLVFTQGGGGDYRQTFCRTCVVFYLLSLYSILFFVSYAQDITPQIFYEKPSVVFLTSFFT